MSSPSTTIRQDLPPPGGYKPIPFQRIPAKSFFHGRTIFLAWGVVHLTASWLYMGHKRKLWRWEAENRGGKYAIQPMLEAERDRAYLRGCRRNRDEEAELMKDVPGWEVGTYYGDKIYHTVADDEWHDVTVNEYFAQASNYEADWHTNFYKHR